jgi:hypothetical protein
LTTNSFTPPSNLKLGKYRVRVQATDAANLPGDWSPYSQFIVRPAPVITQPADSTNSLRPTVSWQAVTGAVSYKVTLTFKTDSGVPPITAIVSGTTWTPSVNLQLGLYKVQVQAFNGANATGDSSFPSEIKNFRVTTAPVSTQPIGRVADSTPTFNWNAVPGADRYQLVVTQGFGNNVKVINESNLTGTIFTQPTPLDLGSYTYTIRAINDPTGSGGQVISTIAEVYEFLVVQPPTVTGPALTTFNNHPTVTWVSPASAKSFDVLYRLAGGAQQTFLRVNGVTGNSYTPDQKTFGIGTYTVLVRAHFNDSNGQDVATDWSVSRTFRVSTPPVISGPSGRVSDVNPTLTWASVPGALNYEVEIGSDSLGITRLYTADGITALNYTIRDVLPLGQYSFRVRAQSQFGFNSEWSPYQTFLAVAWPNLTGPSTSTFNARPSFSWTNMMTTLAGRAAGAERYEFRIYQQDPATNIFAEVPKYTVTNLTDNSYTIPTDLPDGDYRAYIRGIANGRASANVPQTISDFSFALQFSVGGRPQVTRIPPTTDRTPTLLWQAVDGASGYQVFLSTSASEDSNLLNDLNDDASGTSFVVPQALNKGTYRYWIRAINAATGAYGPWSEKQTLTIVDAGDLQSEGGLSSGMDFVWTVIPGMIPQSMVTESAVSMIPAIVDGSQYLPVPEEVLVTETEISELPMDGVQEVINPADGSVETDSVLSAWDQQVWWESQPVANETSETKVKPLTAGFLGALFALAPRSIRRRKNEE